VSYNSNLYPTSFTPSSTGYCLPDWRPSAGDSGGVGGGGGGGGSIYELKELKDVSFKSGNNMAAYKSKVSISSSTYPYPGSAGVEGYPSSASSPPGRKQQQQQSQQSQQQQQQQQQQQHAIRSSVSQSSITQRVAVSSTFNSSIEYGKKPFQNRE